mmetsp:Transcript_30399/g.81748  ORF Transcript_30399/g.81748 Transcript_30399/m.81748 type:complete len:357 (+) Transcript_30399:311-1381(+)
MSLPTSPSVMRSVPSANFCSRNESAMVARSYWDRSWRSSTFSRKDSYLRRFCMVCTSTICLKLSRSMAHKMTSSLARTVAARGVLYMRASSPKMVPGPRVIICLSLPSSFLPLKTSTSPESTTKNSLASRSPWTMMSSPADLRTSYMALTRSVAWPSSAFLKRKHRARVALRRFLSSSGLSMTFFSVAATLLGSMDSADTDTRRGGLARFGMIASLFGSGAAMAAPPSSAPSSMSVRTSSSSVRSLAVFPSLLVAPAAALLPRSISTMSLLFAAAATMRALIPSDSRAALMSALCSMRSWTMSTSPVSAAVMRRGSPSGAALASAPASSAASSASASASLIATTMSAGDDDEPESG